MPKLEQNLQRKQFQDAKRFHKEDAVDFPVAEEKRRFKIEVHNNFLVIMIEDLKARFSNANIGVLKPMMCISPTNIVSEKSMTRSPSTSDLEDLYKLMQFYQNDLSPLKTVSRNYENLFFVLNTWEFSKGEAVPKDHQTLLQFLKKYNLRIDFLTLHLFQLTEKLLSKLI